MAGRFHSWLQAALCVALVLACTLACLVAAGCSKSDDREAGRAVDYTITEQDVIDYIDDFRSGSATTSDDDWAAWMGKMGATPESLRKEVVNYLGQAYLVERAAELRGVSVSDEDVDAKLEEQKSLYTSDMAFTRALINSGYTEEYYRLSLKSDLLREKIKETFVDPVEVSDKELVSYANLEMTNRVTRKSNAIFIQCDKDSSQRMSAKAKATDARNKLLEGEDFASVFAEYSSTEYSNDGDMGYDLVSVPNLAYGSALRELSEAGDVSDVVEADDGYYVIVMTDLFEGPEGRQYKLSQFPESLLDAWRSELASEGSSDEYDAFMKENVSDVQIAVEPMPDGLPYDVEPTGSAQEASGSQEILGGSDSDGGTSAADAADDSADASSAAGSADELEEE